MHTTCIMDVDFFELENTEYWMGHFYWQQCPVKIRPDARRPILYVKGYVIYHCLELQNLMILIWPGTAENVLNN